MTIIIILLQIYTKFENSKGSMITFSAGRSHARAFHVEQFNSKSRKDCKEMVDIEDGVPIFARNEPPSPSSESTTHLYPEEPSSPVLLETHSVEGCTQQPNTITSGTLIINDALRPIGELEETNEMERCQGTILFSNSRAQIDSAAQLKGRCVSLCDSDGYEIVEHPNNRKQPSSQQQRIEDVSSPPAVVLRHNYENTTPAREDSTDNIQEHDYVNVLSHSYSLSLPLLSEHECHSGPTYVNYKRQASVSVLANQFKPPSSQMLPPRKCTLKVTDSAARSYEKFEASSTNDESGYVNILSPNQMSLSQPVAMTVMAATNPVSASLDKDNDDNDRVLTSDEHDYINVPGRPGGSLFKPIPPNINVVDASLIPPRTIPRKNYHNETPETIPLPPRSTVLTSTTCQTINSTHNKVTPPDNVRHDKITSSSSTAGEERLFDVKAKPLSRSSSYGQLDERYANHFKHHDTQRVVNDNSSLNNYLRVSSSMSDSLSCSEPSDVYRNKHPIRSAKESVVKGEFSESVESLDVWPPVIPRHSELKYIVPDHEPEDLYSDTIDMITNQSYVNYK